MNTPYIAIRLWICLSAAFLAAGLEGTSALALGAQKQQVVVYTALDQVFSEPVLRDFEKKSGIRVRAVYDIEATKTTGLVNRLIAEKGNPQCDVFWNNEVVKTIILKRKGVLAPYISPAAVDIPSNFKDPHGYWAGLAARARVLVVNTERVLPGRRPLSIFDLTQEQWHGSAAIANPLFGTTATHVAALFAHLGKPRAETYFKALKDNQVRVVDGNSVVRDQVGAGELSVGFTDTDDVSTGVLTGMPITAIYPDQNGMGTLLIPNTVCLIAGAPHPTEARQLIDYLLSREVEEKLAFSPSVQMPLKKGVAVPADVKRMEDIVAMPVDYEIVADVLAPSVRFVQALFIR